MNENTLKSMSLAALFTVLIIIGSYIAIPIGPVPIVIQNLFVLLAGALLGQFWGVMTVGAFLALGVLGLPVFASGKAGAVHLLGPTGGYLLAYLPAVFISAFAFSKKKQSVVRTLLILTFASVIIYSIGVPWLKFSTDISWSNAVIYGMIPFLIGDTLKIFAVFILAKSLKPILIQLNISK